MIDDKSRYRRTPTVRTTGQDGEPIDLLELREIPRISAVFHTTVQDGERLDHLAWRYYRDATAFWKICDASDHLDPYDVLEPGEPVEIPPDR